MGEILGGKDCPNCGAPMIEVEGVVKPADIVGGIMVDEHWGRYLQCTGCDYQEDEEMPEQEDADDPRDFQFKYV
jgi:hypothetical protein